MSTIGDVLFLSRDGVDLDTLLRHEVSQLQGSVDAVAKSQFEQYTDEEIATLVAAGAARQPLSVDFDGAKADVREQPVEARDIFGLGRGTTQVPGLRATKSIPFEGDPQLWHLRTNPWSTSPPRGEVRAQTLLIGIEVTAQSADEAKRYIDQTLGQIREHLQRQEAQIAQHNSTLKGHALPLVKARRARLGTAADLLKKLGG